ncbi:hypothetical protein OSSY52_08630 [Tepiditoga spiralis]|uniref:Uncharacterized protein n=1 Tax=Tepiditoga spiralis TaxID=2108365 RepID=A0A7G1G9J2_9BACT|nr:hypothetical protein [Tepiditoga spiralis]BBE30722.1 hypothetical protein OSSY52_08630 [Tepiditoga spiralis]
MKKTILFLILTLFVVTIFARGTVMSVLGLYTLNLDDKNTFSNPFPILYFKSELAPNLELKFDYYLGLSPRYSFKVDENGEYDLPIPNHYSLNYTTRNLFLTVGNPKFKSYSYDFIKEDGFRIGGFKDDLATGIGGYLKAGILKLGGYYNLNYSYFETDESRKDGDDSYALMVGMDSRYQRLMGYLSKDKYGKLNLSIDGYHSFKVNRKTNYQFYYGAGYAVNATDDMQNDLTELSSIITTPKIIAGMRMYTKPVYVKGLFYYNLDTNGKNNYHIQVDGANDSPNGKTWLYDFKFGYQLQKPWTIEGFIRGNSKDEGILTDYITDYGATLIGDYFSITFAMKDANGRTDGNQNIVISFSTWNDFAFLDGALLGD